MLSHQLLFVVEISIMLTFFRFSLSESESVSLSLTYFRWFFFVPELSEKFRAWSKMLEDVVEEFLLAFCVIDEVEKSLKKEKLRCQYVTSGKKIIIFFKSP
jgi:hypothetical protein